MPVFWVIFQKNFKFGKKLAAKRIMVVILRSFRFFWHPWHPWGRLSSGDIWVLRFVLNILLQWRHLADFFIFIKMISHISFMIWVLKIVILSLLKPKKVTITKIHHLIRLRFEQSEHKKSQCVSLMICFRPKQIIGDWILVWSASTHSTKYLLANFSILTLVCTRTRVVSTKRVLSGASFKWSQMWRPC